MVKKKKTEPKKQKLAYWAVCRKDEKLFKGTFLQCWDFFTDQYPRRTIASLMNEGIRIARAR